MIKPASLPERDQVGTPVCSVCVANYNGKKVLRECLDSLRRQDCSFLFEVIVHDDASCDGSAEIIASEYPECRLIRSGENVGFCIANNRMVQEARGRFVLLLNNDAALFPDALSTLYAAAQAEDPACILGLPQFDARSGELLDRGSTLDLFFNAVPNRDRHRSEVAMVAGACLWLSRDLWQVLGGFPSWFGSIAEDLAICSLARLHGVSVQILGRSGFAHRVGESFGGGRVAPDGLRTTTRRRALSERNRSFVVAMLIPLPWVWIWLPVHLAALLLEGLALALVARRLDLLREIYLQVPVALWSHRRRLFAERRRWQALRRVSFWQWLSPVSPIPYKLTMLVRHGMPKVERS